MLFMGLSRQEYWSGLPLISAVDHILSGPNYQGHALQLLSVVGWDFWWSGCLTAGPHWAFKPSMAVGCQPTCSQGLRQRPCWSSREGCPGKAGADVGWRPGAGQHPGLTTAVCRSGTIHCLGVTVAQGPSSIQEFLFTTQPISHPGATIHRGDNNSWPNLNKWNPMVCKKANISLWSRSDFRKFKAI